MMNHTLNHMTVPKRAPIVIHCPASVVKSPLSPVKPLPKIKYFQSSIRRPDRNVNIAPQRNHACSTSLASTVHLLFLRVYFAYPTDSFQTSSDPAQVVL